MSTVKSSASNLTLNADGAGNDVIIQGNGTATATVTAEGLMQYNSGYGSVATAYGCRAWVNFNGTGTVAIRGSGNVSSITDIGTGKFTVNFTTAMPDVNFAASAMGGGGAHYIQRGSEDAYARTTSSYSIYTMNHAFSVTDPLWMSVTIHR
tara:strand:- start:170 stop:622 length:453 start_codon:yes stop_codon:yes gene_type:complete